MEKNKIWLGGKDVLITMDPTSYFLFRRYKACARGGGVHVEVVPYNPYSKFVERVNPPSYIHTPTPST